MKSLSLVLFSAVSLFAVTGTVTNEAGTPLRYVTVILNESDTVYTDSEGKFNTNGGTALSSKQVSAPMDLRVNNGTIALHLANNSDVSFSLYTVQGRSIPLYSGELSAGTHTLQPAAMNSVASGIYLFEMIAGGDRVTQKYVHGSEMALTPSVQKLQVKTVSRAGGKLSLFIPGYSDTTFSLTADAQDLGTIQLENRMKFIPAKDSLFPMGKDDGLDAEKPRFTAMNLQDFYMDSAEVSQRDFDNLMKAAVENYVTPVEWAQSDRGFGDTIVAHSVNWYEAALYCNARSKAEGLDTVYSYERVTGVPGEKCEISSSGIGAEGALIYHQRNGYRLPKEMEWEYAYRAGTTTDFFWGDESYRDYTSNVYRYGLRCASAKPNEFGLYDMGGSVEEWCLDNYHEYDLVVQDPVVLGVDTAYTSTDNGQFTGTSALGAVVRGSWYGINNEYWRASHRTGRERKEANGSVGFRVVRPVME